MTSRLIIGDVYDALATIADGTVDLIVTSPPFLSLRAYLPDDHPDKAKEIGQESTPAAFIDTMLDVVEACRRVLAPHGSLVFELSGPMAGSGGAGGDYQKDDKANARRNAPAWSGTAKRRLKASGFRDRDDTPRQSRNGRGLLGPGSLRDRAADEANGIKAKTKRPGPEGRDQMFGWPLDKSDTLIPQAFALSLSYGFNVLRGEPRFVVDDYGNLVPADGRGTEPWRIRNVIAWCKLNPAVGSEGDKFRRATSYLTVATMAIDRYFDADAVRVKNEGRKPHKDNRGGHMRADIPGRTDQLMDPVDTEGYRIEENVNGRPLYDWWMLPTQPYKGAHYATFGELLVQPLILSMCPAFVCLDCHKPELPSGHDDLRAMRQEVPAEEAGDGAVLLPTMQRGLEPGTKPTATKREVDEPTRLSRDLYAGAPDGVEIGDGLRAPDDHVGLSRTPPTGVGDSPSQERDQDGQSDREFRGDGQGRSLGVGDDRTQAISAVVPALRGDVGVVRTCAYCGSSNFRPGVVLDPFVGSGTTMQVATRLAREAIGIDIDERNVALVQARVGMFLTDVDVLRPTDVELVPTERTIT